ncbi:DUF1587 domain-containing protein [bacterium]|nr:DUF1587 domain-containing protein [bacterium]
MGHLKTTHFQICFLIQYMKYFLSKSTLACLSLIMLPQGMASATEEESIASFLQNHCVKCHGEEKQKGDLRLDQLDVQISEHASVSAWQDVLDMLNTGEMPPEDETQPPKEELTSFIGAITDNITSAHKRLADTGGKISMRHLTKREYLGSMEDLFGIELPRNLLPDDVSGEFDTIGSDQFFSLKQYENFYKAGKAVVGKNLLAITSPLLEQKTLRHDPEIAPAEAAKAAYEKMITVKEMLEAGAPYSEIAKIDPKVADEGQGKLFISRYPKRSVKPIANYEKTKGKKGVTGSFNYSTESRPRSVYKLKLFALEASEGGLKIRVNGKAAGEVKFQSDQTRVSSYMMPSQSVLSSMGITIPVHALSHYNISEERTVNAGLRDQKCMELFGYLLDRLKEKKDLSGQSLYDSCLVSYGSNIRTGHMLKNVPAFVTGNSKGRIRHGQHIVTPEDTALCDLWLTLLQTCDVPAESFGDSGGTISQMLA